MRSLGTERNMSKNLRFQLEMAPHASNWALPIIPTFLEQNATCPIKIVCWICPLGSKCNLSTLCFGPKRNMSISANRCVGNFAPHSRQTTAYLVFMFCGTNAMDDTLDGLVLVSQNNTGSRKRRKNGRATERLKKIRSVPKHLCEGVCLVLWSLYKLKFWGYV